MEFETVIGLEVHVEISTRSKVFCACKNDFHAPPNTNVCPVCLGMPGVLPVLNRAMVEASVAVGLALNCSIARWSKMDRKNYFYPDLAKNYQISQYDLPLCRDGYLDVEVGGATKRIRIRRAHMEEDTARNTHTLGPGVSGVDFNRAGVPLLEIVTEPDIHSAEEAYAYLTALKQILMYLDVSDCNMEEGSLRAEPNISIRPKGATELGVKTEVKNVASFSGVQKAIEFEVKRQAKTLREGGQVQQETRGWDADRGLTLSQRLKESAHDYRYFPEPDLVPIVVDEAWEKRIREALPELPHARRERFKLKYSLSDYDTEVLTADQAIADYFEDAAAVQGAAKSVANWIMGDLQALLIQSQKTISPPKEALQKLQEQVAMDAAIQDAVQAYHTSSEELRKLRSAAMGLSPDKVRERDAALKKLLDANLFTPTSRALPSQLADMVSLIESEVISGKIAKEVIAKMFEFGNDAQSIVDELGLLQISDVSEIETIVRDVLAQHPGPVAEFRSGKTKAKGFLVGQVMKAMQGKGNPQVVNRILDEQLSKE